MTAVEEIQAAIEKLTSLRDECGYFEMNGWLAEEVPGASGAIDDPGYAPVTNDPLMVTLHRTIDAQLDILSDGLNALMNPLPFFFVNGKDFSSNVYHFHIELARAINGTA
ncbi:hypothetical protein [Cryobacterium sp. GrIS_2_6]|uniref:hypothetical protein n=1 Tax=Cryobacterium sp. GrIS_2_6 TaxID=3162785 RepID=UPI002E086BDE|nr:hypothetical protein [Cryobacterium psychrotolerans]MEC5149276.1 hypothetical protein [Cryobacterium psychrotolerans]MEC5149355.1 hypothetical protein [Cryobacterium psychrotolerans]